MDAGASSRSAITPDIFDGVQKTVFKEMFYNTFQRFRESPAYAQMKEDIKSAYNKVQGRASGGLRKCLRRNYAHENRTLPL